MTETKAIVWASGPQSQLLDGSEGAEELGRAALPKLLAKGWAIDREIASSAGVYFILRSPAAPPRPLTEEEKREQQRREAEAEQRRQEYDRVG